MKLGNKIKKIMSVDSETFSVKLKFADGGIVTVSMKHIFEKPKGLAAEVLRGGMFEKCFIESGALAWPNGLEFCPDAMIIWSETSEFASKTRMKGAPKIGRVSHISAKK